jgi:hypothetical protein
MTRRFPCAAAIALLAACGHKTPATTTTTKGSDGPPLLIKSVTISFASKPAGDQSEVYMPVEDETGKVTSYPVGTVPGACATIPADGKDLATLECKSSGPVVRLHAVQQGQDVVVLRETLVAGAQPDPLNREEISRASMPGDAAIKGSK